MSDVPCKYHAFEQSVKCIACENSALTARLAEAEAALKLRTAEVASCKSACEGEMDSADEYKAERDEARTDNTTLRDLLRELAYAAEPFTSGDVVDETSATCVLIVKLERLIGEAQAALEGKP